MEARYLPTPQHLQHMSTSEICEAFLIQNLLVPGEINLVYSHADRMIIGGAMPGSVPLKLEAGEVLAATYFAERREIGIINIGGAGAVEVDDTDYMLTNREMIYVGRGSKDIQLSSAEAANPARFFLISLPAHTPCPTTHIKVKDAAQVALGSQDTSNKRVIYQYIHEDGVKSCQLVMGVTELESGNVWNTMPPHTHERRSEVYLYFNLAGDNVVFHFMGQGNETRHIVMRDGDAVISPSWSIHAGAGTQSYCFVWAMGGENQAFSDMDAIPLTSLA